MRFRFPKMVENFLPSFVVLGGFLLVASSGIQLMFVEADLELVHTNLSGFLLMIFGMLMRLLDILLDLLEKNGGDVRRIGK